ncbi:MAG: hypothetical protein PUP46_06100 [Endozoicomonas sp. (ex Botrylloides leachii)]|nr:hypothetical protein [Endozoicomonas sp. (ex Botrylloides leachii)]
MASFLNKTIEVNMPRFLILLYGIICSLFCTSVFCSLPSIEELKKDNEGELPAYSKSFTLCTSSEEVENQLEIISANAYLPIFDNEQEKIVVLTWQKANILPEKAIIEYRNYAFYPAICREIRIKSTGKILKILEMPLTGGYSEMNFMLSKDAYETEFIYTKNFLNPVAGKHSPEINASNVLKITDPRLDPSHKDYSDTLIKLASTLKEIRINLNKKINLSENKIPSDLKVRAQGSAAIIAKEQPDLILFPRVKPNEYKAIQNALLPSKNKLELVVAHASGALYTDQDMLDKLEQQDNTPLISDSIFRLKREDDQDALGNIVVGQIPELTPVDGYMNEATKRRNAMHPIYIEIKDLNLAIFSALTPVPNTKDHKSHKKTLMQLCKSCEEKGIMPLIAFYNDKSDKKDKLYAIKTATTEVEDIKSFYIGHPYENYWAGFPAYIKKLKDEMDTSSTTHH